jgi:hypothetical protein
MKQILSKSATLLRAMTISIILIGMVELATAAQVTATKVNILEYIVYGNFGNGDITFSMSTNSTGCNGAWISPAQPGAKNLTATLFAAKFSSKPITVTMDDSMLWTGSGTPHCKVIAIGVN